MECLVESATQDSLNGFTSRRTFPFDKAISRGLVITMSLLLFIFLPSCLDRVLNSVTAAAVDMKLEISQTHQKPEEQGTILVGSSNASKSIPIISNVTSTISLDAHWLRETRSWHRKRRQTEDLNSDNPDYLTLTDQDPICKTFLQSIEIKLPKDPAASLDGLYGVPSLQKPTVEYLFQTPQYPDLFPHNTECIRVISAPSPQHRVVLLFRGIFELEPEPHCTMDFLEVRDGAFGFSPLIGRFCSKTLFDVGRGLESTGPHMWLRFRSDSTIAHRGFQAVYQFTLSSILTLPKTVYRYMHRFDLSPGDVLKLDESFLLDHLREVPYMQRSLPIEAVFDIRMTDSSYIMLHIEQVQVHPDFAWTCLPDELSTILPKVRCISENSNVFAPKKNGATRSGESERLNKLTIQDPSSIINGRQTYFEVYPHRTISQYSPPCPKVRRFCDRTVGIPNTEAGRDYDRDILARHQRVVIRLVTPSPFQQPNLLNGRIRQRWALQEVSKRNSNREVDNKTNRLFRTNRDADNPTELRNMPKFEFHITTLAATNKTAEYPCDEDWIACDAETCIPKSLWCDKTINCPQWQDESSSCEVIDPDAIGPDGRRMADAGKSSYELRKEQEAREQEAERLAAFKLHLSILASLGSLLFAVTATCIGLTLRRRHRERVRQVRKIRVMPASTVDMTATPRSNSKMNHVMSDGVLLECKPQMAPDNQPTYSLARNNSNQGQDNALSQQKAKSTPLRSMNFNPEGGTTISAWNSTDSMDAPLLWQKPPQSAVGTNMQKQSRLMDNQWHHTNYQRGVVHIKTSVPVQTGRTNFFPLRSKRSQVRPMGEPVTPSQTMFGMTQIQDQKGETRESVKAGESSLQQGTSRRQPAGEHGSTFNLPGSPHHFRVMDTDKSGCKSNAETGQDRPRNKQLWVAGLSQQPDEKDKLLQLSETTATSGHSHRAPAHAEWGDISCSLPDAEFHHSHFPNCRMINRTQSWGGCLKTAGIEMVESWQKQPLLYTDRRYIQPSTRIVGNLQRTNSREENEASPHYIPSYNQKSGKMLMRYSRELPSGVPGTTLLVASRSKSYTNMPSVSATFIRSLDTPPTPEQWEVGVAGQLPASNRDLKPPSAKRPRIISSTSANTARNSRWVPTRFTTGESEEDLSIANAVMDTSSSSTQNNNKPIFTEDLQPIGEPIWRRQSPGSVLLASDNAMTRERVKPFQASGGIFCVREDSDVIQCPIRQTSDGQGDTSSSRSHVNSMVDYGLESGGTSELESICSQAYRRGVPYEKTSHLVFQDSHPQHGQKTTHPEASAISTSRLAPGELPTRGNAVQSLGTGIATRTSPIMLVYTNQPRPMAADETPAVDDSTQVAHGRYIYEYET